MNVKLGGLHGTLTSIRSMYACLDLSMKFELYMRPTDFEALDKMPGVQIEVRKECVSEIGYKRIATSPLKVCFPPRVKLVFNAPVPA